MSRGPDGSAGARRGPTPMVRERVPRGTPHARWWMYERPHLAASDPGPSDPEPAPVDVADGASGGAEPEDATRRLGLAVRGDEAPPAMGLALGGTLALILAIIAGRLDVIVPVRALVPLGVILLLVATARITARRHPDESWLAGWLVAGVFVKLGASYARYLTLTIGYGGIGDATGYDGYGRRFASAWMAGSAAPDLPDLRRTNFLRWFTGVVYYVFGSDMLTGFLVFGLIAFVGSYAWYRATVDVVPVTDKRLYLILVLFVPSIAFWPSSIGKEALMQLGLGVVALGTSLLVRQRLVAGLAVGVGGGWLLWVVRPHLLAMVAVATGVAYLVGRVRRESDGRRALVGRPLGIIAVGLLVVFTVTQGAEFLGLEDFSISSIEAELDEQTERTSQGGSEFETGENSLSPLSLPQGAATVLLRPFPWEVEGSLQLLASLESVVLAGFIVARWRSLQAALVQSRARPFLMYCWLLTLFYAATFSSFANFGLLVRQRSLVLPAVFVLLVSARDVPSAEPAGPDPAAVGRRVG